MSPVESVLYKVNRAKFHLDNLRGLIEEWRKSHLQSVQASENSETGEYVVEIRPPLAELDFALVAGDFICCLRSALDHLTWQMYVAANPNSKDGVPKRISFPVYENNSEDIQKAFVHCTFGLPEEAIALIRSLQPYQYKDSHRFHQLWILNTLWSIDKHRQIPMHSAVSEYIFAPPVPKVLRKEDFDDHSRVYFALADKSSVKIYPLTDARVIFGDDKEGAIATIESFDEIYKTVRDKIIPAFTPFLP